MLEFEISPLILYLEPVVQLTDEQFYEFCQLNRELRIERSSEGELVIMSPTGAPSLSSNIQNIGKPLF